MSTAFHKLVHEISTMYHGVSLVDLTDEWFDGAQELLDRARLEVHQWQTNHEYATVKVHPTIAAEATQGRQEPRKPQTCNSGADKPPAGSRARVTECSPPDHAVLVDGERIDIPRYDNPQAWGCIFHPVRDRDGHLVATIHLRHRDPYITNSDIAPAHPKETA